jgi:hypothetical protein
LNDVRLRERRLYHAMAGDACDKADQSPRHAPSSWPPIAFKRAAGAGRYAASGGLAVSLLCIVSCSTVWRYVSGPRRRTRNGQREGQPPNGPGCAGRAPKGGEGGRKSSSGWPPEKYVSHAYICDRSPRWHRSRMPRDRQQTHHLSGMNMLHAATTIATAILVCGSPVSVLLGYLFLHRE